MAASFGRTINDRSRHGAARDIEQIKPRAKGKNPNSRSPHRKAIKYPLDGSPLIGPEKRKKKAIRTARCLSAASFGLFRFFLSIAGPGQSSGSPFLGYLFWRSCTDWGHGGQVCGDMVDGFQDCA